MSRIALILSGFASIPLGLTINLKNFPNPTPKAYFSRFSFMWYDRRMLKVSWIWSIWSTAERLFTHMTSA